MIANERQHRIAKAELRRFEGAIGEHGRREPSPEVAPRIHRALGEAMESEAEALRTQIKRYEDLRKGRIGSRKLDSLRELPVALIEARIVAGLTQKELARRLGVPEQQVQRWESSLYSGVGVGRLQEIADALGLQIRETVRYAVPS